jgi:hypothetical protein
MGRRFARVRRFLKKCRKAQPSQGVPAQRGVASRARLWNGTATFCGLLCAAMGGGAGVMFRAAEHAVRGSATNMRARGRRAHLRRAARQRAHIRAHVQSVRSPGKIEGGATSTLSDAHPSPASEHEHTQMSNKGVVKAVLSCDTIIVMGVPQVRTASYISRSPGLVFEGLWLRG